MKRFVIGRFKSISYALNGFKLLVRTEDAIITHFIILLIFTLLGFYFKISHTEWLIQILTFGIVLAVEGMNTAIEKMCDFIHPDFHSKIGEIKDVSAGAVTMIFIAQSVVFAMIYFPYIVKLF